MTLDWLIIGGGIHGVHIAARLIGERGVAPERLRIVDPADRLLARWRVCTETVGMTHLRSPAVHHLDLDSHALRRFSGKRKGRRSGLFAPPYNRPALELFNAHCDHVMERFELADLHIRDRALRCAVSSERAVVRTSGGLELDAERVVLAIGAAERPVRPAWARDCSHVHHIFDPGFSGWPSKAEQTVAVVGGGISAGQVALRLQKEGHRVHLVARHALREHQFDSDPGWLGPKRMASFDREPSFERRRRMIEEARHRGSVPPDVRRGLRRAIEQGRVAWSEASIEALDSDASGLALRLGHGAVIEADRVLLATGLGAGRPGGAMVDALVAEAALPCGKCGFPIVDRTLRWHPRLHVSGPLAELELGPTSRNIAGARRAADRLVAA